MRLETALLALICDRLGIIAWMLSDDGKGGASRPKSIFDVLLGRDKEKNETAAFSTPEAFHAAWQQLAGGD